MSLWYVAHLTTYLDLQSCKILRSGFDFKSNLTSAIGDLANRGFLASYVSRHRAMAYDRRHCTAFRRETYFGNADTKNGTIPLQKSISKEVLALLSK
jgi:hypothetical protein